MNSQSKGINRKDAICSIHKLWINGNLLELEVDNAMVNDGQINDILMDLNNNPEVISSLVVSRSGMHMAGHPPEDVHLETFAAMAAILISAAESASSGLKGEMQNVFVELDRSRVIIDSVGRMGVLVVITNTKNNHDSLNEKIKITIGKLAIMI